MTIGERMEFISPGWKDRYMTTFVLSIHPLANDEIPQPTGPVAYESPDVEDDDPK